ncbi:hypothetical protein AB840_05430 [Megasphaera cerevisiae DSM 20462]|jgi:probable DNA metabolism protein|uniref:DUF4130 domain-containing protein n=1 Tax=Megasphaera cerevisiae DSM 20462 TaxID=1122219 RepID=A0A0J6WTU1_9FIRM|nr:TIGR03915 family putative DNA repair protein [Megasphaera cerevisiae]KMO86960.1 hypothetical protein AB840_05430 [Megasphaera cerevisiae DSM 20462]OKY54085.1 hypothetical protein BSR42_03795 [Megasphaera cerevisiae]SJZ56529.1 probable DNA metabolism protein [Megasphaera cerevisiae DSM 20462]
MIYTYDGTFFGFLSAVFDAWHIGLDHVEDIKIMGSTFLFGEERNVYTDEKKAQRILTALQTKCGGKTCHVLYYAFLAEQPDRGMKLLRYIRQAFHLKDEFLSHLSDEEIWEVRKWAQKTGNERHKLLGLIRFQELSGGMLYSRINPTCCVVPVMAPHFVRRLPGEEWVIHDIRRHMGIWYEGGVLSIIEIPRPLQQIDVSDEEAAFTALWKKYYQTIAIGERSNEGLRRRFMPKKYWPYIVEMRNEKK